MSTLLSERVSSPVAWRESSFIPATAANSRCLAAMEPSIRILYVDDEPQLRRLGELALTQSGYNVDTAVDGVEAWAALHDVDYNLLITDQEMPRVTGLKLAAQARLAGMRLPIVLASDSADALRDSADAWLGLAARLPKPLCADSLLKTVEEALHAANKLRQCKSMISVLAHLVHVQPYPHGGINE